MNLSGEEALLLTQSIADSVKESILILDSSLQIISANKSFYRTFQLSQEQTEGRLLFEPGGHFFDFPELHSLLSELSFQGHAAEIEVTRTRYDDEMTLSISGRKLKSGQILLIMENMTAQEQTKRKQIRWKAKYDKFVNGINSLILAIDRSGRIAFLNKYAQTTFGYSCEEILGKPLVGTIIPESDSAGRDNRDLYDQILSNPQAFFAEEIEGRKKDGTAVWFSWNLTPQYDEQGEVSEILIDGNDISELVKARSDLEEKSSMLDAMLESIPEGVLFTDRQHRIRAASRVAGELFGAPAKNLLGTDERERLEMLNIRSPQGEAPLKPEELPGSVVQITGKPCSGCDFLVKQNGSTRIISANAAPIRDSKGNITGSISALRDVTAERQYLQEIEKRKNVLDAILEFSPAGIMLADKECIITEVNRLQSEFLKIPVDEILGKKLQPQQWGVLDKEGGFLSFERMPLYRAIKSGKSILDEEYIFRQDGAERIFALSAAPILDKEGQITGGITLWRDITEQKKTSKSLEARERQFRSLFEFHRAVMLLVDPDSGQIVDANESAARFYGYDRNTLKSMKIPQINQLAKDQVFREMESLTRKEEGHFIFPHRLKSGEIRWVEVYSSPIRFEKKILLFSIIHDITERREAERNLNASEQRFKGIFNNAAIGIMQTDKGHVLTAVNDEMCAMLGYTREELVGKSVREITYPDDLELSAAIRSRIEQGEVDKITYEKRYVHQDRSPKWFSVTVSAVRDERGVLTGTVGTAQDISDRKRVEQELASLSRQRQLALDAASMGWWRYDPISRISTYDDRYREIFGVSGNCKDNDEILSQIIHPDDLPALLTKVEAALNPTDSKPFEARYRINRPDGQVRWIEAYGIATFEGESEARKAASLVGTVADITDRKRAEEDLRSTHELIKSITSSTKDMIAAEDSSFRYTFFNDAYKKEFRKLWGSDIEESTSMLEGMAPWPEEQKKAKELWSRALNGESFSITQSFGPSEKEMQYYDLHFNPLRDEQGRIIGAAHILRNVTEQVRTQQALKESQERLIGVLESMPDAFVSFDKNLHYTYVNRHAEELQMANRTDLLGKDIRKLYPDPESYKSISQYEKVLQEQKPVTSVSYHAGFDRWIELTAFPTPEGVSVFYKDISEKTRAEMLVQKSRAKLDTALSSMTDAVFISDEKGNFLEFNDAFAKFYRFTSKEEYARSFDDLPLLIEKTFEDGTPAPEENWAVPRALRGERVSGEIYNLKRRDTGERWVGSYSFAPIRDNKGKITGSVVVARDITNRKQLEDQLRRERELLATIIESIPVMITLYVPQINRIQVNRAFEQITGWTQQDSDMGNLMELIYPDPHYREEIANFMQSLAPGFRDLKMTRKGGTLVETSWANVRLPDGRRVGIGIDISERKEAEYRLQQKTAELEKSNNFVNAILQTSGALILVLDRNARIVRVNDACKILTGYPEDELLNSNITELLIPEDEREGIQDVIRQLVAGAQMVEYENHWITKTGEKHYIRWRNTVLLDDEGIPEYAVATGIDISDRIKIEQALRISEAQFRELADSMPQLVWTTRPDGYHDYFNQQWYQFTGTVPGETQGELWARLLHPDDYERTLKIWHECLRTGKPYHIEYRFRRASDGTYRWFLGQALAVRNEEGVITRWYGTCTDIQELKAAEAALRLTTERYHLVNKATHDIIWDWDLVTGNLSWNEAVEPALGKSRSELGPKISCWYDHIHPDDRQRIVDGIHRVIAKLDDSWSDQYRFGPQDGPYRQYLDRGFIARDEEGNAYRMIGSMLDVTERIRAEQELRESEERFRSMADNISQLAWMADPSGWIFWYNKRWYDYTGTTLEEMQGWGWSKVVHREHVDRVLQKARYSWDSGTFWEDTFPLRKRNGNYRWFLTRAVPIRNELGDVVRWFGTNTDITDRLNIEEELKKRTEDLTVANNDLESFSYSVSHDLRTPLSVIKGMADILVEDYSDKLDEEGIHYAESIITSTQKAVHLVDDILNLSRIGRQEMKREEINLSAMVGDYLKELHATEPSRSVEFVIQPNVIASADPRMLHVAIENLLRNAWKFTSKEPVSRIEFGSEKREGKDTYFIRDNGAGFDMKFAQNIFEPFKRVHAEKQFGGTGVGLSIVQRVISRHGGKVWAEGEVGKGAIFRFQLM